MTIGSDEDYDYYCKQKASYEAQLAELKAEQKQKIARLEAAYDYITTIKSDFKTVKKQVTSYIEEDRQWAGENKETMDGHMTTYSSYNITYYKYIDDVHDTINNEITALENEMREGTGIFANLVSTINSIGTALQNWLN